MEFLNEEISSALSVYGNGGRTRTSCAFLHFYGINDVFFILLFDLVLWFYYWRKNLFVNNIIIEKYYLLFAEVMKYKLEKK